MHFLTPRLSISLRDPNQEIDPEAYGALVQPEVLAPLPGSMALVGSVADWVHAREAEAFFHEVSMRQTGALAGAMILAKPDADWHLGYLLAKRFWGQGLASELVKGLVQARPSGQRIFAGVSLDNPASARVLEKAGFVPAPVQRDPATRTFVLDP